MRISDWSSAVCSSDLRDAPSAVEIARIEIAGQTGPGVICYRERLFLGREANKRRNRPKNLCRHAGHRRGDITEHRRSVKIAAHRVPVAASKDARALPDRIENDAVNLFQSSSVDQRTDSDP